MIKAINFRDTQESNQPIEQQEMPELEAKVGQRPCLITLSPSTHTMRLNNISHQIKDPLYRNLQEIEVSPREKQAPTEERL